MAHARFTKQKHIHFIICLILTVSQILISIIQTDALEVTDLK